MLEDTLLILRFKHDSHEAFHRIYEKYRKYLLKIASALLHDIPLAEDVVQDVFLGFAQSGDRLKLYGNLKSYLRTCVIHSVRNKIRSAKLRSCGTIDWIDPIATDLMQPDCWILLTERAHIIHDALCQIPFEQREVVVLHLYGGMKFREIAKLQAVPMNTIRSQYRYGLDRLRSLLNSDLKK